MFDFTKAAYDHGEYAALGAFGLTKEAGWFGTAMKGVGKFLGIGGKAVGATGVGAIPGAVMSGVGSGISSLANGENLQTAALRTGAGAVAGAMPAGSGFVAGAAMDAGIDRLAQNKPAPTGITHYRPPHGPAVGHMPGMIGGQHELPGGAA